MNVRPPGVLPAYDDCDLYTQARIIAFGQIRELEDFEQQAALAGAKVL